MKIAIVSRSNKSGGGASKVAEKLCHLLNENGHYAHHYRRNLVNGYTSTSTSVYGKYEWIAKKTYYKLKYFGFQEIIPWEYLHLKEEIKKHKYDIIHFHDLTTAISPFTLILLSKHIPVIWTLHDTSGFTGGCINPFGCEEFKRYCSPCPQKSNWPFKGIFDLAFLFKKLKKKLHQSNINLISPSKWLVNEAYKSNIVHKKISVIPNYVDTTSFLDINKNRAKKIFSINQNQFTILLAAGTITSERKGFNHALKILQALDSTKFTLILVGKINSKSINTLEKFNYITSGFITNETEINQYFSAADIFLNCSLGDNFPLVILEAFASGTPVVGFNTGGIKEMVIQNQTGFLSNTYDTLTLIDKIKEIMDTKEYQIWSKNTRKYVLSHFSETQFLNSHIQLYSKVITKFKEKKDL